MYNGLIHIYLIGFNKECIDIAENLTPLPSFEHEISQSDAPDSSLASKADMILCACKKEDAKDFAASMIDAKRTDADLILVAPNNAFEDISPYQDEIFDFWGGELSTQEFIFHLKKWQKVLKKRYDAWETSQFLDATIDSIPSLVWYKTKDGVHEKVNSSFCKTVNKTKDQVQGQRHAYIWDVEEDDPACIESENEVMSSQKTCISEETIQVGDDTKLLTTYKSPLYDIDGSVMGTVGVGIDITQERAYETDLLEKNRNLETIFTTLDCGVLTHSLDGSQILGVNQKALEILGFESEEALKSDGFDMLASTVAEEDMERLRAEITQLTEVGDNLSTEYSIRHDDGEVLHVMGNIKVIEKDGDKYYQRSILDITSRKVMEEQKDIRAKNLIQALSEDYLIVCAFDLDTGAGEILRYSAKEGEFEDIINQTPSLESTIETLVSTRVYDEDRGMLKDLLSPESLTEELKLQNRLDRLYRTRVDGDLQFRQVTIVRSGNWENNHEIIIGFRNVDQEIRDELEQKTLLEQALGNANKANAAKSTFLLNMSHDIRTPMNAIVGFTNLASSHVQEVDVVKEYLDKIKASSDHLLNLINDILDMSRIEQGKVTLDEDRCNIKDVLNDLYSMLHQEAENKGLDFEVDTSKVKHSEIICDRLKVNQIILNLLGNSLKFTNAGGKIFASIEELPDAPKGFGSYRIVVEDTGIGMSEDFLELIFDPFERAKTQTNSGIQGSGLGMAIVKSLVDMMKGSIKVESKLDEGTRFTVNLKLALADESAKEEGRASKDVVLFTPERASLYTILLVDDNHLNREIAESILLDAGFKVEKAINGQDAIDKLVEAVPGHFDLILMDIQMPVMNGYEAASKIRAMSDKALADIPILAVTADAFEEDRIMALEHGMNGHLPKPIEITKLFQYMDEILDDKESRS